MLFKGILFLLFLISCNNEEPTANSGQNIQAYYNTPHGIVVNDNSQTVYLSDRGNGYLYKYSSSGSLLGSLLIDSQNNFVSGINISSDKIYACNQQSSSVSIVDESSFILEKKVEIVTSGSSCYLDATTPEDCSLYQDEGCFWMEMPDDSQIPSHCMPPSSPVESECTQYGTSQTC